MAWCQRSVRAYWILPTAPWESVPGSVPLQTPLLGAVGAASATLRKRPLPARAGRGSGAAAPPGGGTARGAERGGCGGGTWGAGLAGAGPVRSGKAEVPVLLVPVPPPCTGPCTASARPSPTRCLSLPERPSCSWSAATSTGGWSPAPALARQATRRPPISSGCRWAGRGRFCRGSRGWAALPWPFAGSEAFLAVPG